MNAGPDDVDAEIAARNERLNKRRMEKKESKKKALQKNDKNQNLIGDLNTISEMLDEGQMLSGPIIQGNFLEWLD